MDCGGGTRGSELDFICPLCGSVCLSEHTEKVEMFQEVVAVYTVKADNGEEQAEVALSPYRDISHCSAPRYRCSNGHELAKDDGTPVETAEELVEWLKARSGSDNGCPGNIPGGLEAVATPQTMKSPFRERSLAMKTQEEQTIVINITETQDRKEPNFTCPDCGSHELDKCLVGRIGCAVVESIRFQREEHEADEDEPHEDEDEEIEIAGAEVSVQTQPDGSEAWFWGVNNQDDAYSRFRCPRCCYVLRFEDGSPVEEDTDLARWLILAEKKSQ
jgi:hypothetical protein